MVLLAGDAKSQASIVSDAGMVYMSGLQPTGTLNVQWGKVLTNNVTLHSRCHRGRQNRWLKPGRNVCR